MGEFLVTCLIALGLCNGGWPTELLLHRICLAKRGVQQLAHNLPGKAYCPTFS